MLYATERENFFKSGENTWKIYFFTTCEKNGSGQSALWSFMPEWLRRLVVRYKTSRLWSMNSNRIGVSSDRKSLPCHCSVLMFRDSLVAWVQFLAHKRSQYKMHCQNWRRQANPFLLFVTCCYLSVSKVIPSKLCQDSSVVKHSKSTLHSLMKRGLQSPNHWFNISHV